MSDPWAVPTTDPFAAEDYAMTYDDVIASTRQPDTYHHDQARDWRHLHPGAAIGRLHAFATDLADRIATNPLPVTEATRLADRIAHTIATLSLTETHLRNTSREDTP